MTRHAILVLATGLSLTFSAPPAAAESPAELISNYRLKHGEVRVTRDATLDRIAMEQARAMAAKDHLSHDALGPFARRMAPSGAGRAAENIAYGYESFEKTLGQWIDFERASQEPAAAESHARRDRERQGRKRQAHLLGDGDRRRLRAEARQGQRWQGRRRGPERGARRETRGGRDEEARRLEMPHQPARPLPLTVSLN